jgi:hypothetical protein
MIGALNASHLTKRALLELADTVPLGWNQEIILL